MMHAENENHVLEYLLMALSVILSVTGFLYGRKIYQSNANADDTFRKRSPAIAELLSRKYYVDEAYDSVIVKPLLRCSESFLARIVDNRLIDGFVNSTAYAVGWIASRARLMQTGILQNYVTVIVLGILVVLSIVMFG
jgi:NADH-quinone oxidoreductase subunit L